MEKVKKSALGGRAPYRRGGSLTISCRGGRLVGGRVAGRRRRDGERRCTLHRNLTAQQPEGWDKYITFFVVFVRRFIDPFKSV